MKSLLEKVKLINDEYDYKSTMTGEKFNLFSILNVEYDEVRTHSSFITELINPNGSHNQNSLFFKLFIEKVGIKNIYDTNKLIIRKERYSKENGRVDIWIHDYRNVLIIENKINAEDQNNQLEKYFEEAKKITDTPHIQILYLSLDGCKPSEKSLKKEGEAKNHVKCISYRDVIIPWLEECIKGVSTITILREAINQYLILIRKITGDKLSGELKIEIINLLKEGDNFKQAVSIYNHIDYARKEIEKKFWERLKEKLDFEINNKGMSWIYKEFDHSFDAKKITLGNLKSQDYYGIYYVVESDFLEGNDLVVGVEIEYNIYIAFSLIDNEGKSLNIYKFKDDGKIKRLSDKLSDRDFNIKYEKSNSSREMQLIGWKYPSYSIKPMSLFDINHIVTISRTEDLDSYANLLKASIIDAIQNI